MPRTIAIGDIHGCDTALAALLSAIAPEKQDTIVTLGDLVDRGPNTAGVIELLLDQMNRCHLIPLIGNHEIMMFSGLENRRQMDFWLQHGGIATLASYGNHPQNIPAAHRSFLGHCLRYYESDTHLFVHANYDWQTPLEEQDDALIFWQHIYDEIPPPHMSGKRVIIGHTPQFDGRIRNLGHAVLIDTYCYGNQWLTALDVDSNRVWQANNSGEIREAEFPGREFR
jgi:serine/threonine protein phosphatase 1